jgi:hydrogenase maturation protease
MIRVIGVGNPGRGDDGAGRAVARRLRTRKPCGLEVRESDGEAVRLLTAWDGVDHVVLVDACHGAGRPGSIHVVDIGNVEKLTTLKTVSTHSFGVAAAVGLARALDRLPSELVIYAIEGSDFGVGEGLTPEVDRAVDTVVALLVHHSCPGTPLAKPRQGET